MNGSVLGGVLLIAICLGGSPDLSGQNVSFRKVHPTDLPEAPQPCILEAYGDPNGATASAIPSGLAIGQTSKGVSRPGFPPISLPIPVGAPIPLAGRVGIPNENRVCEPESCSPAEAFMSCPPDIRRFNRFLTSSAPLLLTPKQKFLLAYRNVIDPFNFLTIAAVAAYSVGSNAYTPEGPGFSGFAKYAGVSLTQDIVGEFFGTFLIPALARQDPHYHRMPNLPLQRRILHVVDEVVISQGDDGSPMFNYATVFGTIGASTLGNLYVPGRNPGFASSVARISTALATDPIGNAITEFLPDVARRINIRVVLVERVINRVAVTEGSPPD